MKKKKLSEINVLEECAITFNSYATNANRYALIHKAINPCCSSLIVIHKSGSRTYTTLMETAMEESGLFKTENNNNFISRIVSYQGESWVALQSRYYGAANSSELRILVLSGRGVDVKLVVVDD